MSKRAHMTAGTDQSWDIVFES